MKVGLAMGVGPFAIWGLLMVLPSWVLSYETGMLTGLVLSIATFVLAPIGALLFVVGFVGWFNADTDD